MDPIRLARWSTVLAIAIAAVALLVGLMLVIISQMPSARNDLGCKFNMIALSEALRRYHWPNEGYPATLEALRKEYLRDPAVLRCPLDRTPGSAPSYTYTKPSPDSPDNMVILECDRHGSLHNERVMFIVTKGGEWSSRHIEPQTPKPPASAVPPKEEAAPPL